MSSMPPSETGTGKIAYGSLMQPHTHATSKFDSCSMASSQSDFSRLIPPAANTSSSVLTELRHRRTPEMTTSYYGVSNSETPDHAMAFNTSMGIELPSSTKPFATSEDFENMVGDLRRTFIGWLKKTEGELRAEREAVRSEREQFEEQKKKQWQAFMMEKKLQLERLQEEKRRAEASMASSIKQIAVEREDARQRIAEEREKLNQERLLLNRQVLMEREKLAEEQELFEAEKRKVVDANIAVQTMIDLNVGGVVFETSRLTLVQQQGSFLEALLSGRHAVNRDRSGRIFFDRDSDLFRIILQFLRNPSVPVVPRDAAESLALCAELEYYGLKFHLFPLVFALGGHNGVDHLSSVEVLDVGEQSWRPCAALATPRTYFGATYHQGRIFVYGGQNFDYKALCDVELYDILRDTWMPAPNLNVPRRNNCGITLESRCFCIGGFDGAEILASVEAYDPRMKNWMEIAPLVTPRSSACCVAMGNYIYALGGTSGERLRTVERFDQRANAWQLLTHTSMIEVRSAACAAAIRGFAYVFGGTDNSHKVHTSVESLEYHSEKWSFRRDLPQPRMDAACSVITDTVMIAGGQEEDVYASTLFFRTDTNEWTDGPTMLTPRYGHALITANI